MPITILILSVFSACTSLPETKGTENCKTIKTGPGPEDIELFDDQLIVSSHDRRAWKQGEILLHQPLQDKFTIMPRVNEPEELFFSPHGISLENKDQKPTLYVINHGLENEEGLQSILVYLIENDKLIFTKMIQSELLTSPNDLVADGKGGLYIVNDAFRRGSLIEAAFSQRKSRIVYCNVSTDQCKNVGRPIGLGNSAAIDKKQKHLYVSTMFDEGLLRYSISDKNELHSEVVVYESQLLDNLYMQNNQIYFSTHLSSFRFLRHASSDENESPSLVSQYNIVTDRVSHIYGDTGEQFSAASGAVVFKQKLVISGVFSPNLLICDLTDPL